MIFHKKFHPLKIRLFTIAWKELFPLRKAQDSRVPVMPVSLHWKVVQCWCHFGHFSSKKNPLTHTHTYAPQKCQHRAEQHLQLRGRSEFPLRTRPERERPFYWGPPDWKTSISESSSGSGCLNLVKYAGLHRMCVCMCVYESTTQTLNVLSARECVFSHTNIKGEDWMDQNACCTYMIAELW